MESLELGRQIVNVARKSGTFLLTSGTISDVYWNKYKFESDPVILKKIAICLTQKIPPDTQVLAGMELGGIPLVTAVSLESGLSAAYIRYEPKLHGTKNRVEGAEVDGKITLLLEDVVTTGGTIKDGVSALQEVGASVGRVLCVILRSEITFETMKSLGLGLNYLFTMAELENLV